MSLSSTVLLLLRSPLIYRKVKDLAFRRDVNMDGAFFMVLLFFVGALIVIWTSGAIFYDVGRASLVGGVLATAWLALALGALIFWQPIWKPFAILLVLTCFFLWWWFSQLPSHHRNWAPGFTELSRVELEGNALTIENVRNTEYRTLEDCTPKYETRTYRLAQMRGVDALLLYWGLRLDESSYVRL